MREHIYIIEINRRNCTKDRSMKLIPTQIF